MDQNIIDKFYKRNENRDDLQSLLKDIDEQYNHIYDSREYKLFMTEYSDLMKKKKWDNDNNKFIIQQINSGYGPILDELFLTQPCGEYYRLLRIHHLRSLEIKKKEDDFCWMHNNLPMYLFFGMSIVFPTILCIGVFNILTFIVNKINY